MKKYLTSRRSLNSFLILSLVALLTQPALAWNQVGHRTVAELAWRKMSPAERKAASDLLKQHPHYELNLVKNAPKGVDRDEWTFLTAAVWPDWVRPAKKDQPHKPESVTKYNKFPHAIGHPFLKAGETNHALLNDFFIAKPNCEMVLSNSLVILNDPKASAPDRAVALCWVLHLFGDLHQPLHAANRVTPESPKGEGLGGDHFVLDAKGEKLNLHVLWDQLPGMDWAYKPVAALANKLEADPALQLDKLPEYRENKSIPAWVQESFRAAVDFAYSEKKLDFVHATELKKKPAPAIPAIKAGYMDEGRKIAHRRLVLAAQRLADELKQIW